jgi:hypothetical protein
MDTASRQREATDCVGRAVGGGARPHGPDPRNRRHGQRSPSHRPAGHRLEVLTLGLRSVRDLWMVDDGDYALSRQDAETVSGVPFPLQTRPARLPQRQARAFSERG